MTIYACEICVFVYICVHLCLHAWYAYVWPYSWLISEAWPCCSASSDNVSCACSRCQRERWRYRSAPRVCLPRCSSSCFPKSGQCRWSHHCSAPLGRRNPSGRSHHLWALYYTVPRGRAGTPCCSAGPPGEPGKCFETVLNVCNSRAPIASVTLTVCLNRNKVLAKKYEVTIF